MAFSKAVFIYEYLIH